MAFRYATGSVSIQVEISASYQLTVSNKEQIGTQAAAAPTAGATLNISFNGCTAILEPIHGSDDPPLGEGESPSFDEPHTFKLGYRVTLQAFGNNLSQDNWVQGFTVGAQSVKTGSITYTTAFSVTVPTVQLMEQNGVDGMKIIDAPFPTKITLLEAYDQDGSGSASCGGLSVSGIDLGYATYNLETTISATASDTGSGNWGATPTGTTNSRPLFVPDTGGSVSDSYGSGSATATQLTLTATRRKTTTATMFSRCAFIKSFGLTGVVRAMEEPYPDALMGTCSKFKNDPNPEMPISGGAFSASYDQRHGIVSAAYNGGPGTNGLLANFYLDEYQPISCRIEASSLEVVGEDLSPPPPPPDPETGQVNPFAEQGPPRATRIQMRGRRFDALSLALAQDFLVDNCGALTVGSGTFQGAWEASGGDAPTLSGGGIKFVGSVRRAFTPDVSFSSYRYLRLHIAPPEEGEPAHALQAVIGGKTFKVRRVGETDYYFVDLCAETNGPPLVSAAGTKWPLKQRHFPIVRDGMPKFEKAYMGIGRCQSLAFLSANADVEVTLLRVELSRRAFYNEDQTIGQPDGTPAPVSVTFLPAFYRGKFIYEDGPDAPPTDLDKHWPTREFETRYFGGGYEQPADLHELHEDFGGLPDEYDDYEDAQSGGEDAAPDAPNKTRYWARRFLLAHVNGRQGLEEKDSSCQVTETPLIKSISWSQESIASLVGGVNAANADGVLANPGWTAVNSTPQPAPVEGETYQSLDTHYLTGERPATWIYGGGALYGQNGWVYGFDKPLGAYQAQMLFDEIDWFPGCGDVFNFNPGSGGASTALVLTAAAILRAAAQGVVLSTKREAVNNKGVELRQVDPAGDPAAEASLVSQGTSTASGFYKTSDLPFAKTRQLAIAKCGNRSAEATFHGRKRQRFVFVVVVPTEGGGRYISADIGPTGRHVRAFDNEDENVMIGFSNAYAVNAWSDAEIVLGARPCVRYDANGNINLLFEQEDSIVLLRSDNDGRTYQMPITVSNSGTFPALAIGASGLLYSFWRTEDGGIAGKILDVQGSVVYPATGALTVIPGGVAEDGIVAWCDPLTRRVFVKYRDESDNLIVLISADNGRTYS